MNDLFPALQGGMKIEPVYIEVARLRIENERLRGALAVANERIRKATIELQGPVSEAMRAEVAR